MVISTLQADFAPSSHTAKQPVIYTLAAQRGCVNHQGDVKPVQLTVQPARVKSMAAPDRMNGYLS